MFVGEVLGLEENQKMAACIHKHLHPLSKNLSTALFERKINVFHSENTPILDNHLFTTVPQLLKNYFWAKRREMKNAGEEEVVQGKMRSRT